MLSTGQGLPGLNPDLSPSVLPALSLQTGGPGSPVLLAGNPKFSVLGGSPQRVRAPGDLNPRQVWVWSLLS